MKKGKKTITNHLNNSLNSKKEKLLHEVTEALCSPASYEAVMHRSNHEMPMPSVERLDEVMDLLRTILFPGYFGHSELTTGTMHYYIGSSIDKITRLLAEQITRGFCYACPPGRKLNCAKCEIKSLDHTEQFIARLPYIRDMLSMDVHGAFIGDPAAKSPGEIIFCYPSIKALTNQRLAHELYKMDIPLIPRIITEIAHSATGIDIHPGAEIGESFFMDHGTGIVIGETSIIGNNVRIYQGVTLGAKSFPLDSKGNPIKGIPRHPIVEDDVIIYSGATILGRIRIGKGAVIGGNVWITQDVPAGSRILQST